ncbi:Uncharacterised protein [Bordetella avium]|nr:Uncharacterised protein [Bordetella avium]
MESYVSTEIPSCIPSQLKINQPLLCDRPLSSCHVPSLPLAVEEVVVGVAIVA